MAGLIDLLFLIRYLCDEHTAKTKEVLDLSTWDIRYGSNKTPQQNNMYDCGIFVCATVDLLSLGLPLMVGEGLANRLSHVVVEDSPPL